MVKQGHVGNLELFATTSIYESVLIYYSLPTVLAEKAATGAWLLNIEIGVAGFLLFLPLYFLLKRFPGQSIISIAENVTGAVGGIVLTCLIAVFYMLMGTLYSRGVAGAVTNMLLVSTPVTAILAVVIMVAGIVCYLGIEGITRTALIFSPFILFGFLLLIGATIPDIDFSGLYPIMGVPVTQHVLATFQLAPQVHDTFFLAILAPYIRRGRGILSFVFSAMLTVTVITLGLVLIIQLLFPYPGIKTMPYEVVQAAKMIHIGRFMQRIESLFFIQATVSSLIHFCLVFHLGVLSLGQGLKLADWRPLILPWGIIVFALAYIPQGPGDVANFYYSPTNTLIFAGIGVMVPLLLYLISVVRGKKGESGLGQQAN